MPPPHAAARSHTLPHVATCCRSRSPSEPPFSAGASPYGASSRMLPEPLPFGASVFSWSLPLWSLLTHAAARSDTLPHVATCCRSRSPSEPPHSTGASPLEPPPGALEPPHSSRTCSPSEPPHSTGASPLEPPPGALGSPPAALELQAVQPLPPGLRLLRLPRRRICVCDGFNLLCLRPLSSFSCRHVPHCCHGLHCLLRLNLLLARLAAAMVRTAAMVCTACSASTSFRRF